jgi:hypothetical protein
MELKRIASFFIQDTNNCDMVDDKFCYKAAGKINKAWLSAEKDYFVCHGLTYPEIKVTAWTITEDIYGTFVEIASEHPLKEGSYELLARGTLSGDFEEIEQDPDIVL